MERKALEQARDELIGRLLAQAHRKAWCRRDIGLIGSISAEYDEIVVTGVGALCD